VNTYHQFSTKYIEIKNKNLKNNLKKNTNWKTMAQSLHGEVVDTIMFQE
jgi:glutaredoxin-related protein